MKAFVASIFASVMLCLAVAQLSCPDVTTGANRYTATFDVDRVLLQTLDYVYVITDPNAVQPSLIVDTWYTYASFQDAVSAQVSSEGQLIVQPQATQNETCVYLTLPANAAVELTVNDETTIWFVGTQVSFSNLTLNVISGDFVAGNTTQLLANNLIYNATGQGISLFESTASRADNILVNITGNSNFTWGGAIGTGDVAVGGQGFVGLQVVENNLDVALVGFGSVSSIGGATATFTGIADAPNKVAYMLGTCTVAAGDGASPTFFPCHQLGVDPVTVLG